MSENKLDDDKQSNLLVTQDKSDKTSIGLTENVGGMLCYIFIIGIVFLIIEKENRFIRFHALQAVFTALAIFLIGIVLGFIPIIGFMISLLLGPLSFVLMIFLMYQAYKGNYFKLPFIGDLVENQLNNV
ncbi:DUF4870 domain-containing protein [Sporosarcina thermotolerans]|uniref:DUF4870 domain-containing protein n=2 Tax=Sporosarcina thermotolerans TaxID=633404 RepID=A0AAW9A5W5_9BACL|nr:DUF4870 domain-containing protein [Sporosarcina thermotolerans]MDW0115943.1 DUF4870 domain-containing protein [Sporosarcina thermotolerans]